MDLMRGRKEADTGIMVPKARKLHHWQPHIRHTPLIGAQSWPTVDRSSTEASTGCGTAKLPQDARHLFISITLTRSIFLFFLPTVPEGVSASQRHRNPRCWTTSPSTAGAPWCCLPTTRDHDSTIIIPLRAPMPPVQLRHSPGSPAMAPTAPGRLHPALPHLDGASP